MSRKVENHVHYELILPVCVRFVSSSLQRRLPVDGTQCVLVVHAVDAFFSIPFVSTLIAPQYLEPGVGVVFCTPSQNRRSVFFFSFVFDHHYVSLVLYLVVSSRFAAREKSIVFRLLLFFTHLFLKST